MVVFRYATGPAGRPSIGSAEGWSWAVSVGVSGISRKAGYHIVKVVYNTAARFNSSCMLVKGDLD